MFSPNIKTECSYSKQYVKNLSISVKKVSGNRLYVVRMSMGEENRRGELEQGVAMTLVKRRDLLVANTVTSKMLLHFMS